MMKTDAAAAAADLDRLVIRPYAGEADLPEIHGVTNADFAADGVRPALVAGRAGGDVPAPIRQVRRQPRRARRRAGWRDRRRRSRSSGSTPTMASASSAREVRSIPRWRRRGIGRRLMDAAEALGRERSRDVCDGPARCSTACGSTSGSSAAARWHWPLGYAEARWFFEMERSRIDVDRPEILPLPDGLEVRPASRETASAIWAADHRGVSRSLGRARRVGGEPPALDRRARVQPRSVRCGLGRRRDRRRRAERRSTPRRTPSSACGAGGWTASSRAARGVGVAWLGRSSGAASTSSPMPAWTRRRSALTPTTHRARSACTSRADSSRSSAAPPGRSRWRRDRDRGACRPRDPAVRPRDGRRGDGAHRERRARRGRHRRADHRGG